MRLGHDRYPIIRTQDSGREQYLGGQKVRQILPSSNA